MKKLYALLVFALLSFAIASCTEEEVKPSASSTGTTETNKKTDGF